MLPSALKAMPVSASGVAARAAAKLFVWVACATALPQKVTAGARICDCSSCATLA